MSGHIAVIGCGYVGLTTGACLAHLGHTVVCADIDSAKIRRLKQADVPILEAGLDNMIREGIDGGRLSFVVGEVAAATDAEFAYLCVPTPQSANGSADLSFIEQAASAIGPVLPTDAVVVNKSTVPVGSTRVVEQVLGRSDVFVVSNPEFLREGSAVHDFLHPDRIVIGSDDQAAAIRVASLYIGITAPLIVTDPASAETIKYASNAFLATKISFVNAVAAVCEAVGADMADVVLGMGYDKRIGHEYLRPGPGWGGSCFVGDETVLVRRTGRIRLLRFEDLWAEVQEVGAEGWEVLSWAPGEVTPEFQPVAVFTARPYEGDVVTVRTKMGRRVTTTADHGFVVGDGVGGIPVGRKLASELTTDDWLPLAEDFPRTVLGGPLTGARQWVSRAPMGPYDRLARAEPIHARATTVIAEGGQFEQMKVAWVPITDVQRRPFRGTVFSLETPPHHTVVTSDGVVVSNCFPKDTRALIHIAEDAGYDFDLLRGVVAVNEEQFERVAEKAVEMADGSLEGKPVGVWGLTFKARTDDLRESPALAVIARLVEAGAKVRAYDPTLAVPVDASVARLLEGIEVAADPYAAIEDAAVLLVLTEWDDFKWLDFDKVADSMAARRVVDARNLLDREALRRRGFEYRGVGRI